METTLKFQRPQKIINENTTNQWEPAVKGVAQESQSHGADYRKCTRRTLAMALPPAAIVATKLSQINLMS